MSTHNAIFQLDLEVRELLSSGIEKGIFTRKLAELVHLVNGTSNGQINKSLYQRRTTTLASTALLGGFTDEDGVAMNFDEVVLMAIRNRSTTAANYLTLASADNFGLIATPPGFWTAATDTLVIPANSLWVGYWIDGIPCAAGSDNIDITVAAGADPYDLVILGRDN